MDSAIEKRQGIMSLSSVILEDYKEVTNYNSVSKVVYSPDYLDKYSDIHIYSVKLKCEIPEETKYFFNGSNFFINVVALDEGEYKLIQALQPLWQDLPYELRFNDFDEEVQIFIQSERMKGNIIGSDGRLIEVNRASANSSRKNYDIQNDPEIQAKAEEFIKQGKEVTFAPPAEYFVYKGTDGLSVAEYLKTHTR